MANGAPAHTRQSLECSTGVITNNPPKTRLGGRSRGRVASQSLVGALQDHWRCWRGQLAVRTPTRTGSPSTAGPPSTPPSWPPPRAAAAAGTRSAAPTANSPAAPSCWPSCSPAPGPALSSTPSSCRSMPNTSPTARGPGPPCGAGCPPGWLWLWLWGSAASCPLQLHSRSAEPGKGLKPQRAAAWPLPAPLPARGRQQPSCPPALGTNSRTRGQRVTGTGLSTGGALGVPGYGVGSVAQGEAGPGALDACICPGVGGTLEEGCWVLTLYGLSPFLRTPGWEQWGCQAGAGAGAGFGWQPPSRPCPSRPCLSPLDAPGRGGHAEIIGCLPGRGSHRPAGGSSGSNKEQDQGGSNPAAPGAPGPDGFQMQPLAFERSRGALESWPGEGRAALPGHLPGSATPGEIIFLQQGGSL